MLGKSGKPKNRSWSLWLQLLGGLLISALGYRLFLVPNGIVAGGFTGIGQLVNRFSGWPVGMVALALNIPLFALSLSRLSPAFCLRSLLATVVLSFLLDSLPVGAMTRNPVLAALFGGALAGAGFGLTLRGGATTGGSEMLGKLISSRMPIFTVGSVALAIDILVIGASALVFDADKALLAMVSAFIINRTLDTVVTGPNRVKAYYIVSTHTEEIAARIMLEMNRGVTGLAGKGMYSGQEFTVLLCVVSHMESLQLRRIVSRADPDAFVIAADVYEALGKGFSPIL